MSAYVLRISWISFVVVLTGAWAGEAWGQRGSLWDESLQKVVIEKRDVTANPPKNVELTAVQKTQLALEQRIVFDLNETTLVDFVKWFGKATKIPVVLDAKPLEAAGVATETPLTFQHKKFLAGAGLRLVLKDLNLCYVIHQDGTILVTTVEEVENCLISRVYNVLDVVTFPEVAGKKLRSIRDVRANEELLIAIFHAVCATPNLGWVDDGGVGTTRFVSTGLLAISQTQMVHDEIEQLLTAIRRVQADYDRLPHTTPLPPISTIQEREPCQKFRQRLGEKTALKFTEKPLSEVLTTCSERYSIPFLLDRKALEAAGIATETHVNAELENVSLEFALRHVLKDLGLIYLLQEDFVLVTTIEEAENLLRTVVYPLRDLIPANANREMVSHDLESISETLKGLMGMPKPGWVDGGGVGSLQIMVSHQAIVVSQTSEVHEQIDKLLAELRQRTEEMSRVAKIERQPIFPTATYPLMRDRSGKLVVTSDEFAAALKKLLPDVDWELAGTSLFTFPDRVIVRHERETLQRINALRTSELNGWVTRHGELTDWAPGRHWILESAVGGDALHLRTNEKCEMKSAK